MSLSQIDMFHYANIFGGVFMDIQIDFTMDEINNMTAATVKATFSNYIQPCKYEVYLDERLIYVGSSRRGLLRVVESHDERMPHRSKAFKEGTKVVITFYSTWEEALNAEHSTISSHNPEHNRNSISYFGETPRTANLFR